MIYDANISTGALNDLDEILSYISNELLSFEDATNLINILYKIFSDLSQFPERFRIYKNCTKNKILFRVMQVERYLVFYEVNKVNRTVEIMRDLKKTI